MNAPVHRIQNILPAFYENTEGAVKVTGMKIVASIGYAKTCISNSVRTRFFLKLVSGVALGALFLTVVVGFPSGGTDASDPADAVIIANDSGSSRAQQRVDLQMPGYQDGFKPPAVGTGLDRRTPSRESVEEFFSKDVVETLGYEVLIAGLNQYKSDGQLSSSEMERLDHEIDMLLRTAGSVSSGADAGYNRVIDGVEQKISTMLEEAKHNPSANLSGLNREIERLDHEIDALRLASISPQQSAIP